MPPLLTGLVLGAIGAVIVPFGVTEKPETFGGLFAGTPFAVPFTEVTLQVAWPVMAVVTLLVWGLLSVAR